MSCVIRIPDMSLKIKLDSSPSGKLRVVSANYRGVETSQNLEVDEGDELALEILDQGRTKVIKI